mmetsp:Transcript_39665/g.77568  ORF Transcript_39665/g.77568 Transcript_39665/m.77568 type:complete len:241 (-) Transcript_39665:17-739(-)
MELEPAHVGKSIMMRCCEDASSICIFPEKSASLRLCKIPLLTICRAFSDPSTTYTSSISVAAISASSIRISERSRWITASFDSYKAAALPSLSVFGLFLFSALGETTSISTRPLQSSALSTNIPACESNFLAILSSQGCDRMILTATGGDAVASARSSTPIRECNAATEEGCSSPCASAASSHLRASMFLRTRPSAIDRAPPATFSHGYRTVSISTNSSDQLASISPFVSGLVDPEARPP